MFNVHLGGFGGVVCGMCKMPVGAVGMMGGRFVVARLVMLSRFAMVPCRVLVMFSCLVMVFRCVFGHCSSSEDGPREKTTLRDTHYRSMNEGLKKPRL
jgi:hypothetical protein